MATFTFFDEFVNKLATTAINLSSDTFKVALTNTAPTDATDDELADITQIAASGGYTAGAGGGYALDSLAWAETGAGTGIWQFTTADEVITATGGDIGPFRYAVVYDDTIAGDPLVGYLDYGASITVTNGNTFTLDVGANGWFRLGVGTIS